MNVVVGRRFLSLPRRRPRERRHRSAAEVRTSFALTFFAVVLVAGFLSPLLRSLSISLKSPEQVSQLSSPLWPADPLTYSYHGRDVSVYKVPIDGTVRELALVKKGKTESQFVDPSHPEAGLITWQGAWRSLENVWTLAPQWSNYGDVWRLLQYPRLLFNTAAIAVVGLVGTILSCTLVAYGFARFRFRGRGLLFLVLVATIFLPAAVTLIPTYTIFSRIGWVGTWLPLLVPAFFANAYDVFLLRQYLLTIPREMDEAAAIDGAGPLRTLVSVIVPQAWPVITAVAIFHLVYSWNDFFGPLIYLSDKPDLQTLAVGLAQFSANRSAQNPGLIQAGTLMTLLVPVVIFLIFQRVFTKGIVITGVER